MAALGEFDLIERYFTRSIDQARCRVGIGDDAAIIECDGTQAIAIDTLVEGAHFLAGHAPRSVGHRALAVNLSDLAAVGARARWATLALCLPAIDEAWLQSFADGFFALADRYDVALIGGDTTRGHLTITVQVQGDSPPQPLLRSTGKPGDLVFVSGTLGDAAAALIELRRQPDAVSAAGAELIERFSYPEPRLALGAALAAIGAAAIDVSDGLLADLSHLCRQSGCGAELDTAAVPLSAALQSLHARESALRFALNGGDDYELCFAVAPDRADDVHTAACVAQVPVTHIGALTNEAGIFALRDGDRTALDSSGYRHF